MDKLIRFYFKYLLACWVLISTVTSLEGQLPSIKDNNQHELIRNKRQLSAGWCPSRSAGGSDKGKRSQMILYSPKNRQDIKIYFDNDNRKSRSGLKSLIKQGFNIARPTMLYLHAFTQTPVSPWLIAVRKQYNQLFSINEEPTFNLLFFDWSTYSKQQYPIAASYVPHLAKVLAQFLKKLSTDYSYNMTQMHLVSFSLSTHIAGLAGRYLKQINESTTIGQITALDPAGLCFHTNDNFDRRYSMRGTDANLVVARHYNMFGGGSRRVIGGVDIIVNDGIVQPGTFSSRCDSLLVSKCFLDSHSRATEHEVAKKNDDKCSEVAYSCHSYEAYLAGQCADCGSDGNKCYQLITTDQMRRGDIIHQTNYPLNTRMYMKTSSKAPFCLQLYQNVLQLKDDNNHSKVSKKLLDKGKVSVEFRSASGKVFKSVPKNRMTSSNKYTQLLIDNMYEKLTKVSLAKLKVLASTKETETLIESIKNIEINYMSSTNSSDRSNNSHKFCINFNSSSTYNHVKC